MKYTLKIVFGKEQVTKIYNNEPLTDEELMNNQKEYSFATEEEKNSFLKGINEGIGWTECCIPEFEFL
jgi:hypothetical protein